MKSIILAGGEGLRLHKVVKDVPKAMASVAGKPFLEYLILHLVKSGFNEIVLSIGYKGSIIRSYFGSGERWEASIEYSEEDRPLGTGGALKKAFGLVDGDSFVVMNGDSFLQVDLSEIVAYHKAKKATATLGLARVNNLSRYGKVDINDDGEVLAFLEKGAIGSGLINGGVYIFNRGVIGKIPPDKVSLETEVLPVMIKKGLYGMKANGFFIDIGIPQAYLALRRNPKKLLNAIGL